jgi:UDP-GlcNAc:undecaprenyl-phosphate GlcNAc-1-phosphate transferase
MGASLIVLLGVWDDVRQLRPPIKLFLQILAASITIAYGLIIKMINIPFIGDINLGIFAIPFTLLWIVGITNAINLIDGLDGLAGGVTFIASMTLFMIALQQGKTETALFSVVLAGTLVGFLRYNFNPAQIFLGDSGALFLGYSLANFSVMGAMKSTAAVALLIPIIALGFPIMDTFLAMLRRYGRALREGKGLISSIREIGMADKQHMHHKLLELGYTQKKTVVLLYGLCVVFGLFAFFLTAYHDRSVAAILFFVGLIVFVMARVLGYIEFRGLKEGNFLEQYLSKIGTAMKHKESDSNPRRDSR